MRLLLLLHFALSSNLAHASGSTEVYAIIAWYFFVTPAIPLVLALVKIKWSHKFYILVGTIIATLFSMFTIGSIPSKHGSTESVLIAIVICAVPVISMFTGLYIVKKYAVKT